MKFRYDINGLRALAVFFVIASHLGIANLSGGFIGVDIFFVISGYLITSIILRRIESNTFKLTDFYVNRIKRIVPALICMIVFSYILSIYTLFPYDLKIFSATSVFSSIGFNNIFLSLFSGGYFSSGLNFFPLLHTWSLGIEEQFYFIWPLFLIFLCQKNYFKRLVILIIIVLTAISIYGSIYNKSDAYFLIQYRAFELLIGGCLVIFKNSLKLDKSIISDISLLLLIFLAFTFNKSTIFPGLSALLVCFLTSLLILTPDNIGFAKKILKIKLIQFIGRISYSLYLYHWPIIAILQYRNIKLEGFGYLYYFIFLFSISTVSYKCIEQKFIKISKIKAVIFLFVTPVLAISLFSVFVFFNNGIIGQYAEHEIKLLSSYDKETSLSRNCSIKENDVPSFTLQDLYNNCNLTHNKQQKPSVLLFGDSHANHMRAFINVLLNNAHLTGVYHVQGSCYAGKGLSNNIEDACTKRNNLLLGMSKNFEYVVLGGAWNNHYYNDLNYLLTKINRKNTKVIILKDITTTSKLDKCPALSNAGWFNKDCDDKISHKIVEINNKIEELAVKFNVKTIDPNDVLCVEGICKSKINGYAVYRDSNHINSISSEQLGLEWLKNNKNPFSY